MIVRSPSRRKQAKKNSDSPQPGPSLYGRGRSISVGGSPVAANNKLLRRKWRDCGMNFHGIVFALI